MAKKKTAAKQTAKTTTKKAAVSVSDSPTATDRPQAKSATEKHARSGENRNVTAVNTGEGYKETDVTKEPEPETTESDKPTDSCQNLRGNGDTCLDELEKAKENPNRFTQEQLKDILAGNNLCEYCMEQE